LAIIFASLAIALLVALSALFAWKQNPPLATMVQGSAAASSIILPNTAGEVSFTHPRHATAQCADCHHKTSDPNPYRGCHDCHQASGGKMLNAQRAFHKTCIQCHERNLKQGRSAPSRRCSSCHRQPDTTQKIPNRGA